MAPRTKSKPKRAPASLDDLRARIDRLDDHILQLLNARAAVAVEIGGRKARAKKHTFAPERELRVLGRLEDASQGPLKPEMVRSIFREVIAACRSLEEKLRIAYLGPEGTFSHQAARHQFGGTSELSGVDSIAAVFDEVEHGRADYGVVPVENTSEGIVTATLDRFVESELAIKAEALFPIHLMLLSRSGRADRVRRIVSMVQPLAQSRLWLARHFPGVPIDEVSSTAVAAERASRDARLAAVAGALAQQRYGLKTVAVNVQDRAVNVTRFLIIGKDGIGPRSGDDKTTLLFLVRHQAGALHRVLRPFADAKINLLTLESRPLKGRPWEYVFFLDVEGHIRDRRIDRVVRSLEPGCVSLRVLGSYPIARALQ